MKRRAIRGKTLLLTVVILATILFAFMAGCGGESSVEGVYKLEAGEEFTAVITLKADSEATYSLTDDGSGIPVTYKANDGTVVLIGADGKEIESARFTIEEDGLRDPTGNLYKKQ